MYKIFKHCKLPCIPCLGETHIKLQWYNIFPQLFFLYLFCNATFFSTPVTSSNLRNQAPLFTELRLLQETLKRHWKSMENDFFRCMGNLYNYPQTILVPPFVYQSQASRQKCSAALKSVMFMNDFDKFNKECRGWKRFYWIADDIGKWCSLKNLCWRL